MSDSSSEDFVIESEYTKLPFNKNANTSVIGYVMRGRCKKCWGRLFGRKDEDGKFNLIECRLCKELVEGDRADFEWMLMNQELEQNLKRACRLLIPRYRKDAKFVLKIIPDMKRDRPYFQRRVTTKLAETRKHRTITRHDISEGSAGYLYLQACIIMAGIENLPKVESVIPYNEFASNGFRIIAKETANDESSFDFTVETHTDPRWLSRCLIKNMGTTFTVGMNAAFTCELALKAILITRKDEAEKTHDLLNLFQDLPDDSKTRLKVDFNEIEEVIEQGRNVFGKWRYFISEESEESLVALANVERAVDLAKTARVLIDECEIAGLDGEVKVKHEFEIDNLNSDTVHTQSYGLSLCAGESAIHWEDIYSPQD